MTTATWIILIGIGVLIIGFGLYVLFHRKKRFSDREVQKIQSLWSELIALEKSQPEQVILKADKLLDYALKLAGFQGSLGEKLKEARSVFSDNNAVWNAHKLRNRIAHEVHVQVSAKQVSTALRGFKRAFYDLGIKL